MSQVKKLFRLFFPAVLLAGFLSCEKQQDPLPLTEGDVAVKKVTIDGTFVLLDKNTCSYSVLCPTTTDFSTIEVSIETKDAQEILIDGQKVNSKKLVLDLSSPKTFRVIQDGHIYKDYTLQAHNTGLPVVRVETPNHKAITSKETWMEGATLRIEKADGTVDYEEKMAIRGRGNSTWGYPKKPYALKLNNKAEILSMPSHKRWVLLANWKDRTILRNDAAFWLSRHTGLPYTVRGQFVELVLNGEHKGNYYLCEQIKINKNRVNVKDGGLLLELDTYFDEVNRFLSKDFQLPWMVKEPDEEELTPEQFAEFKQWITDLEALLKDETRVKAQEYEQFLDVDTAIDYLIAEELTCNHDFYNDWPTYMPPGPHSTYLYKQPGGKLYTGPMWDFDYHTFVPNRAKMWAGANKTMYYPALLKDEKFRERLVERWNAQKEALKGLPEYLDQMADIIRESESVNHRMWPINPPQAENGDEQLSFQQAVDRMKQAFLDKWEWMDKNIGNLR